MYDDDTDSDIYVRKASERKSKNDASKAQDMEILERIERFNDS